MGSLLIPYQNEVDNVIWLEDLKLTIALAATSGFTRGRIKNRHFLNYNQYTSKNIRYCSGTPFAQMD